MINVSRQFFVYLFVAVVKLSKTCGISGFPYLFAAAQIKGPYHKMLMRGRKYFFVPTIRTETGPNVCFPNDFAQFSTNAQAIYVPLGKSTFLKITA